MDLKIALGLLVALMCVPSGWSYVRGREAEAEEEFYEYGDDRFRPIFEGFPGSYSAQRARIVGGDELPKHEYPFLVLIVARFKGLGWIPWCGGSILNDRHVLTARHCVESPDTRKFMLTDLKVIAGENDYTVPEGKEQVAYVQKTFLHPFYNEETFVNDVAVLRLATPLEFNNAVSPAQLNSNATCPTLKQTCTTAGWGHTSYPDGRGSHVPLYIQVPVADPDTCQLVYPDHFDEGQLCIGGQGKEACRGDSGGPMVCDCGGWKVVGITAYTMPCAIPGNPSVYTEVSYFYDWIMEQTRKWETV